MQRRNYSLLGLIALALVGCTISDGVAPSPIVEGLTRPQQTHTPELFGTIVDENGAHIWVGNVMTIGFGFTQGGIGDCVDFEGLMGCGENFRLTLECLQASCLDFGTGGCSYVAGYPLSGGASCYILLWRGWPSGTTFWSRARTALSTQGYSLPGNSNVPAPNGNFYVFDRWITTTPCVEGSQTGLACTFTWTATTTFNDWSAVAVYRLSNYAFGDFLDPVSSSDLNIAKAGSSVPVKFSLGGAFGLGILAENSPSSQQVTCQAGVSTSSVDATGTAGSSGLSYDVASGTYTYIWKTQKAWAGSCREFTLTLLDGSTYTALFQFVK